MVWLGIIICVAVGLGLIVWRDEATHLQAYTFGAQLHPGCAIVEGVLFMLLALAFYLLYRAGMLYVNLPPY